ncbi:hypothetical protein [Paraburkholderia humisilvae]|uniref:Uncharacterized protein n=1 Tax=Paraburkholderia humisilvae TaxID=627669 RepID=A0A6J5DKZ9_9BURK|nr:hypothetical protein [Paraburkholderia humisilvae]CAB3754653.1 hypothetical protein LMG29542_02412 [Paraburkholderia humisilvae]
MSQKHVEDLSGFPVKPANNWQLARQKGVPVGPRDVVGRCLAFGEGGQSTTIVTYDPKSRRVRTKSGTVYQLLQPRITCAVAQRGLLMEVGFD